MLRYIGIIGYGYVGKACHKAFRHNAEALIIDTKLGLTDYNILDKYNPRITFVCVPAPTKDDNQVDISIVEEVLGKLVDINYDGVVVLKSTIPPQQISFIFDKYAQLVERLKSGPLRLVYSPEFIREAHWEEDALAPSAIVLGGSYLDTSEVRTIYENHSHIEIRKFIMTDYTSAALMKYTVNCFLAMKVTFMNQVYQLFCDLEGQTIHPETWDHLVHMLRSDGRLGHSHMQVPGPDKQFGYGGSCFPKDVKAMIGFDKNGRMSLLREVDEANTQIRLTGNANSRNNKL